MQQHLESSRVGRLLISVFVAATVGAMVIWNMPSSKLRTEGLRFAGPYVRAAGLDQNWSVFAPNPYRDSFVLSARVTFADGTQATGSAGRRRAFGAYWDFRWGKWAEWTIAGNAGLCRGTAAYAANRLAAERRAPVKVELVVRRRPNARPGQKPSARGLERIARLQFGHRRSRGSLVNELSRRAREAAAAWDRFWFAPQSTSTLAVVRIAFALVVLGWTALRRPRPFGLLLEERCPAEPARPELVVGRGAWGPLGTFTSDAALAVTYSALFVAALLLLIGLKTRLAAVLVFVGLMALTRRNIWVLDSGEPLMRSIAFFLMLAPSGAALSLDRRLAVRRGRTDPGMFPRRAPWVFGSCRSS